MDPVDGLYLRLLKSHKPARRTRTAHVLWLLYAYSQIRYALTRTEFWLAMRVRVDLHIQFQGVEIHDFCGVYSKLTTSLIERTRRRHDPATRQPAPDHPGGDQGVLRPGEGPPL
jgi:hypothetical protein